MPIKTSSCYLDVASGWGGNNRSACWTPPCSTLTLFHFAASCLFLSVTRSLFLTAPRIQLLQPLFLSALFAGGAGGGGVKISKSDQLVEVGEAFSPNGTLMTATAAPSCL